MTAKISSLTCGWTAHGSAVSTFQSRRHSPRAAGRIGIPGLYVTADPGAKVEAAKEEHLSLHFGM
jgi:hypothetical protein